jgi:hypothetical protein
VETQGTVDERGAEVLRLISAISNQYPFPTRIKYEQGKTIFEMETMDIHFKDKAKLISRVDDIIWLDGKLVSTIALFPQVIDSLMAGPEKAWRGVSQLLAEPPTLKPPRTDVATLDVKKILDTPGFANLPLRFAAWLKQARMLAEEIRDLKVASDLNMKAVPRRYKLILAGCLLLIVFALSVGYPLICYASIEQADKVHGSLWRFSWFCLYVPWGFFFCSILAVLWPAFRQK